VHNFYRIVLHMHSPVEFLSPLLLLRCAHEWHPRYVSCLELPAGVCGVVPFHWIGSRASRRDQWTRAAMCDSLFETSPVEHCCARPKATKKEEENVASRGLVRQASDEAAGASEEVP